MRKGFPLFLLTFGLIGPLRAGRAEALQPLDEFLARAPSNAFDTREAALLAQQREAEADVALGRLLPALSARGVYTRNQYEIATPTGPASRALIQPENQLDAIFALDVPIVDLPNYYRHRATRALARAASEQSEASQLDVNRAVCRAYYQHLGAAGLLRSAVQSTDTAESNLKNVAVRRGAGVATELDLERARANVERSKQDIADAQLLVNLSARSLETLSGVTPTPAVATDIPGDDLAEERPLAEWLGRASETPQERALREATAAAAEQNKSANTTLVPTLSGAAQERITNATGFLGKNSTYALSLTLGWRLDYVGLKNSDAQSVARELARVREERAKRGTKDAIFEAHQRVTAGIAKSRAARAQAVAAGRASELASDRYSAGAATQLDVTQAQRDAFLADAGRVQADADLMFARASLRLAAGLHPKGSAEGKGR